MFRLSYFIRVALNNIRRNLVLNLVAAATIAMALLIMSSFMLLHVNLQKIVSSSSADLSMTVYLKDGVSDAARKRLSQEAGALDGVKSVKAVSREDALKDMKNRLGDMAGILDGLDENPLPASLEIVLEPRAGGKTAAEALTGKMRTMDGVDDVVYAWEWADKLKVFIRFVKLSGMVIGVILFFGIVFIIANTIRLTLLARKDELYIMRLIGATEHFVRMPFYIEGMLQGLLGSLVSLGVLFAGFYLAVSHVKLPLGLSLVKLEFLPLDLVWSVLVAGALVGFLGSFISLRRLAEN